MKKGLPLPPIVMEVENRSRPRLADKLPLPTIGPVPLDRRKSMTGWSCIHQTFTQLEPPHLPHPHQAHHPPASRSKMCTGYQWDGWRFCKDIMRWCETYGNEIRWVLKNFKQSHATKPCHHFPTNDPAAALSILLVSKCLKQSLLSYLDAQLLPPEPTIWSCTNGFLVFWMHQKCKVFQRIKHGDQGEFVTDYSLLSYLSLFHLKDCKFWFWVPWTVPCYLRSACKFHKELQVLLVSLWPHHCSKSSPSTWPIWDGLLNQWQTLDLAGEPVAMDKSICWYWWMKLRFYSWLIQWLTCNPGPYIEQGVFVISNLNQLTMGLRYYSWKLEVWILRHFWNEFLDMHGVFSYTFCVHFFVLTNPRKYLPQYLTANIIWLYNAVYIYIYTFAPPPPTPMFWHCDDLDKTKINPSSWIDIACYKLMNIRTSCIHNLYFLISIDISLTYLLLQAISLNFKILLISNILIIDKRLLQKKHVVIIIDALKNRFSNICRKYPLGFICNVDLWLHWLVCSFSAYLVSRWYCWLFSCSEVCLDCHATTGALKQSFLFCRCLGVIFIDDWTTLSLCPKNKGYRVPIVCFVSLSFNRPLAFKTHLVNLLLPAARKLQVATSTPEPKELSTWDAGPKPLFVSSNISTLPSRLVCTKPKKGVRAKLFISVISGQECGSWSMPRLSFFHVSSRLAIFTLGCTCPERFCTLQDPVLEKHLLPKHPGHAQSFWK